MELLVSIRTKKKKASTCDLNLEAEWNFFALCHGKNACDGWAVTKASLQRPYSNQILTSRNVWILSNLHLFKDEEIIQHHNSKLLDWL